MQLLEPPSAIIEETARRMVAFRREQVRAAFAAELDACKSAAARPELLDALELASSGRVWDAMRMEQGKSAGASEQQLGRVFAALLADAAGPARPARARR